MPIVNRENFIKNELTRTVKICLIFGITASLLLLPLTIIFFKISVLKDQAEVFGDGNNDGGCHIDPFEADPSPLLVLSGTNEFIYPKHGERFLTLASGQALDFVCSGESIILSQSTTNSSVLSGTCVIGTTFKIANASVNWKDLKCSKSPLSTIRYTGNNCSTNGSEIEIGFEIGQNRFLRSLLICFNQELQVAYYTYAKLPASINQGIRNTPRPRQFQQGSNFYDIGTVNTLYTRKKQRTTVNSLVGLPDNSTKYINDIGSNNFLSRGHLTANMDNFYAAQQNATFFFPNAAPQWQSFNGFNWNQIEIDVRDYAEHNAADLQVWTGVYGVTTLPHETTGNPVELYLYVNQTSNRKALPVPEIYWKVVYNPLTKHGVALIGLNNPYNSTFNTVCQDVSQKLTWLHCDRNNQQNGFCYACSINNFREVVKTMPEISVNDLLL